MLSAERLELSAERSRSYAMGLRDASRSEDTPSGSSVGELLAYIEHLEAEVARLTAGHIAAAPPAAPPLVPALSSLLPPPAQVAPMAAIQRGEGRPQLHSGRQTFAAPTAPAVVGAVPNMANPLLQNRIRTRPNDFPATMQQLEAVWSRTLTESDDGDLACRTIGRWWGYLKNSQTPPAAMNEVERRILHNWVNPQWYLTRHPEI